MNTHNYRPGFMERMKRRARDGLRWLAWKTAKYLSVMALGVALYENSDKIGEAAKDKLSSIFNSGAQVSAAQEPAEQELILEEPIAPPPAAQTPIVPDSAPPERVAPPAPEDPAKYRDGPLWDVIPAPTPPPVRKDLPPTIKKPPEPAQKHSSGGWLMDFWNSPKPPPEHDWTTNELIAKIEQHTWKDPITAQDISSLIKNESGFNVKAISKTGAKGMGQHTQNSQLGDMYTYRHLLPPYAARLAEEITKEGSAYGFTEKADQDAIWKAIEDPDVSIPLTLEHFRADLISIGKRLPPRLIADINKLEILGANKNRHRIAAIQRYLHQPRTPAEGYIAYVAGAEGATEVIRACADPVNKKLLVNNFIPFRTINNNPDIFKKPGKTYVIMGKKVYKPGPMRTAEETCQRAIEIMGHRPLPKDLSRPSETRIATNSDHHLIQPS